MDYMVNRVFLVLISLLLSFGLVGCNQAAENQNTKEPATEQTTPKKETNEDAVHEATVIISKDNQKEIIEKKTVGFKEGENLLSVMEREFKIVDEGGGFITQINDAKVDKEKNIWFFVSVNGKMAEVGAKDIILKHGDEIVWDLHEYKQ